MYGPPPAYEPWGPRNSDEAKNYKFADWDGTPCEETELLHISDAVLIVHHSWLQQRKKPPVEGILSRNKRPLEQRRVFQTKESPGNMPLVPLLNGFFNWTA